MDKEEEKKVDIKTKEDDKEKNDIIPLAFRSPWDFFYTINKWPLDDPWRPLHHYNRWESIFPKDKYFNRLLNQETKISPIDMIDIGNKYKIIAEMPDIDKKDIEINVTSHDINICGELKVEIKEKERYWLRRERTYSTIYRTMFFPEEVNPDKADATLKDGILEMIIEKKNPTSNKVKRIQIK